MKKIIAVLCGFAVICAAVSVVPDAAVSAAPAATLISPENVSYSRTLTASGSLSYMSQSEVTSSLPLVIERYCVTQGEYVEAGEVVAVVDRDGSASFIESLGQLPQLAVAASGISTAISLIPEQITADRTGVVLSTAGSGAAVEAGSSICTIAGTDALILTAPVSEQYISSVEVGQSVTFSLTAYPDTQYSGRVAYIAGAARNRYSGSVLETVVDLTIIPDVHDECMKSGLTAEVKIPLTEEKTICVLSYEAIGQDEGGEFVYVYQDGKAVRRKIFTGAEFADSTEIIKGVTSEDLVFTAPDDIAGSAFVNLTQAEEE